ncbi:MAG: hypothetical protein M9921_13470 [Fimbriimonadaceae bacterium]|nr:hypothetical protein [Fimbriimonadaceae bacterium]
MSDSPDGLPGTMSRRLNVAMMGAGSFFTGSILRDVMLIPGIPGGELRLVDVDSDRLGLTHKWIVKLAETLGVADRWTVRSSTDRKELLPGTDYIVNSIEVSGLECVRHDNDIPLEFGVSQCIGDTIGPGGLFKALRTVPVWLDILRDAERLCPNAQVLNYTNPMNILCLAAARASSMRVVGLCHSVQGTSRMLAGFAGVPYEQVRWECAGINHLAWFTSFDGPEGDLYPMLLRVADDPESEFAQKEKVRIDMMRAFGAFITESSGHLSEYLPYYRKRKEILETYATPCYGGEEGFYAANWPTWREGQDTKRAAQIEGAEPLDVKRSLEYGAWIIEAIEKDSPVVIHGNVPNEGSITNLPSDGCVEVACLVDRNGVQPTRYGALPKPMAGICDSNMRMFDVAAEACIHRSKEAAFHALLLDPLTAAVCSPVEIREMTRRLFEAEAEYLPGFA